MYCRLEVVVGKPEELEVEVWFRMRTVRYWRKAVVWKLMFDGVGERDFAVLAGR